MLYVVGNVIIVLHNYAVRSTCMSLSESSLACSSSSNTEGGCWVASRSSVVRASTAKVGGLGFDSLYVVAHAFFLQYVSILIYHQFTTSSYHQLLLISIVTKIMYMRSTYVALYSNCHQLTNAHADSLSLSQVEIIFHCLDQWHVCGRIL